MNGARGRTTKASARAHHCHRRRWRSPAGSPRPDRGSVLIEQVVALSILGTMVVGVFGLLTVGTLAARIAEQQSLAAGLAAGKLEALTGSQDEPAQVARRPLDTGRFPGYSWQAEVTAVGPALRRVTVTVWWPDRGREHSVSLTTLVRRREE